MAVSVNEVTLIGRLGRDPDIRTTNSGAQSATLSVATDESYKDRNGQRVDKTEWHRVVVWGPASDFCARYLRKGALVYVNGSLSMRDYQGQDGQKHFITEIKARRIQSLSRNNNEAAPARPAEPMRRFDGKATSEQPPIDESTAVPF